MDIRTVNLIMSLFAGLLGAILGSFANVCIVRMPLGKSIISPRSHCVACGYILSWWENIPIFSWFILKAKCRKCKAGISVQYPVVEAVCAVISLFLWWHFGDPLRYFLYLFVFAIPLIIVSFIDLKHRIIPDVISLPGIAAGLIVHTLLGPRVSYFWNSVDALMGAVAGGLLLFLVAVAYEKLRKQEGLGGGDIKLIAMLGAFFGWKGVIFVLFMSSVAGSVVGLVMMVCLKKDMKYALPFGPFLVLAGFVQLFLGDGLIRWYLNLFG